MVRYMENCGRGSVQAIAARFRQRRWLLPLHSVDFVDGRFIPEAVIDRSGVVRPPGRSTLSAFGGQPVEFLIR